MSQVSTGYTSCSTGQYERRPFGNDRVPPAHRAVADADRGEFLETPGLRLTLAQARRRFGVDEITCEAILEALVDATVLFKTGDRVYGRLLPHLWAA